MYLFFDTETNGLPRNWKAPVSDLKNWPRMVQLAYMVFDEQGNEIRAADYIIKPEGFTIPGELAKIHGITTERAINEGVPLTQVLDEFSQQCNQSGVLVAHNLSFDEKIVGSELLRGGYQNVLMRKKRVCTMEAGTNFCKLPGKYGYKWPRLSELHQKLFGQDFEEAHNAAVDIAATARCFWELKRRGVINLM